jgi:hypothetical protein
MITDYRRTELAEDALNIAVKFIQDEMGIPEGDIAGVYFSGDLSERIQKIFVDYIKHEEVMRNKQNFGTKENDNA